MSRLDSFTPVADILAQLEPSDVPEPASPLLLVAVGWVLFYGFRKGARA